MFIIGCLLANIFGTVYGLIMDKWGIFKCRIFAGIPLTTSLVFLIFYENRLLLDIGCYLLGLCALGCLLTNLSLQAIWPKKTSTIGSMFSGTFDGSASTFMLVKVINQRFGIPLKTISIGLASFTSIAWFRTFL